MNKETLKTEKIDKSLLITFTRPDEMNTFSGKMMVEIMETLDEAESDDSVRSVIFTGSGRAYCAGADLSQGEKTFDWSKRDSKVNGVAIDTGGMLTLKLYDFKKPIIAAINGSAVGVGVTMTLPMDVRIASDNAKFGFVFAKRGIVPEACSSWFLPRIVGVSQSLEWMMSGEVFSAEEALKGKLIREVTSQENLVPRALEIAQKFSDKTSAVSVSLTRQMVWKMLGEKHPMSAHKIDSRGVYYLGRSNDVAEGISSFLEKRDPEFSDTVSKNMPEYYPWWKEEEFE